MGQGIDFSMVATFITNNKHYVILVMTVLLLFSLVIFININMKLSYMNKRYKKLMTGMDGSNIERILMAHIDEVRELMKKVDELENENKRIDVIAKKSVQKVGVVRFSAFEGIGSDLSYAVAVLDYNNNGVVFSSIFGREDSRCYAKPIIDSRSTYLLTDEEKRAIEEAIKK
jgi:hypothetical protein